MIDIKRYIMTPAEFTETSLRYFFPVMCVIFAVVGIIKHHYITVIFNISMIIVLRILERKLDEIKVNHWVIR